MGYWLAIRTIPRKNADGNDWLGGEVIEAIEGDSKKNPFTGSADSRDFAILYGSDLTADDVAALLDLNAAHLDKDLLKAEVSAENSARVDTIWRTDVASTDSDIPRLTRAEIMAAKRVKA